MAEAKRIAVTDAGCQNKVAFSLEELITAEGMKTPYYHLIFADTETQWEYKIDAVLGIILEKQQKNMTVKPEFIALEAAKAIALKDAGLDDMAQKVVFTKEELNRNQGKPCYLLNFYTGERRYFYQIDAKTGDILNKDKESTAEPKHEPKPNQSSAPDAEERQEAPTPSPAPAPAPAPVTEQSKVTDFRR